MPVKHLFKQIWCVFLFEQENLLDSVPRGLAFDTCVLEDDLCVYVPFNMGYWSNTMSLVFLSLCREAGSVSRHVLRLLLRSCLFRSLRAVLGAERTRVRPATDCSDLCPNQAENPVTDSVWTSLCCRIICGLTQFTNKYHLAFAALEAVCFQTREVKTQASEKV